MPLQSTSKGIIYYSRELDFDFASARVSVFGVTRPEGSRGDIAMELFSEIWGWYQAQSEIVRLTIALVFFYVVAGTISDECVGFELSETPVASAIWIFLWVLIVCMAVVLGVQIIGLVLTAIAG
jgi:hypothetical protein